MSGSKQSRARRPGWLYRAMMSMVGFFEPILFMSCRAFIRLASQKYERPLWLGERMRQAMHRAVCRICRLQERRMDQLRGLARELGRQAFEDSQAELSPESLQRLRAAMAEAATHDTPDGGTRS
jgi:hypothetical protein